MPKFLLLGLVCGALAAFACTDDSGEGGGGICGYGHDVTLEYETTVIDADSLQPLAGIELYCKGEDAPIGTSTADGVVGFSIETVEQPGCGYERCTNLVLRAPDGSYQDLELTVYQGNGETVQMSPA